MLKANLKGEKTVVAAAPIVQPVQVPQDDQVPSTSDPSTSIESWEVRQEKRILSSFQLLVSAFRNMLIELETVNSPIVLFEFSFFAVHSNLLYLYLLIVDVFIKRFLNYIQSEYNHTTLTSVENIRHSSSKSKLSFTVIIELLVWKRKKLFDLILEIQFTL